MILGGTPTTNAIGMAAALLGAIGIQAGPGRPRETVALSGWCCIVFVQVSSALFLAGATSSADHRRASRWTWPLGGP